MHKPLRLAPLLTIGWGVAVAPVLGAADAPAPTPSVGAMQAAPASTGENRHVQEGVAVEFNLTPLDGATATLPRVVEGEPALLRFAITDAASQAPLRGSRPAVWVDHRKSDASSCREKINAFLQGSLAYRPDIDLSRYFVVTLNDSASLSVIDPLLGLGTSKLFTRIPLPAPGTDWVRDRDERRLYVAVPEAERVAVIDTVAWKALEPLAVSIQPARLAFQPDHRYLWALAADDAKGGKGALAAIDPERLEVVARLRGGSASTGIAFTEDSAFAFATDRRGRLQIIDVRRLAIAKAIKLDLRPKEIAYSRHSGAVYVVGHNANTIVAVDGRSHRIVRRIAVPAGIGAVRFTPDGRWGLLSDPRARRVHVLDPAVNRIVHSIDIQGVPDQISFSKTYAYVRSDSEQIAMVPLDALGRAEAPPVTRFAGGRSAPLQAGGTSRAAAIVPTPEGNAVLVANASDKTVYYYAEGMAAPMGSFQNYGQQPKAVLTVDQGLREQAPGQYSARVGFPGSGTYDVAFLLDSPRFYHCFTATVDANAAKRRQHGPALNVEYLVKDHTVRVGEPTRVRFRLADRTSGEPYGGLKDVKVLALLAPGVWQRREAARTVSEGLYEIDLAAPSAGVYYLFVESPSMKIGYNELPALILQARER